MICRFGGGTLGAAVQTPLFYCSLEVRSGHHVVHVLSPFTLAQRLRLVLVLFIVRVYQKYIVLVHPE